MPTESGREFLGVGLAFPIQLGESGDLAVAAYEEDVRQAVRIILETSPGERVMRPDFGAGLRDLVFEPMNTATLALARHRVEQALVQWEPRIDSISVQAAPEPELGRLLIDVRYRTRATNTFYNFVYPFYLLEAEPA